MDERTWITLHPFEPGDPLRTARISAPERIASWHNLRTRLAMVAPPSTSNSELLRDTRGAVMSEYVVLIGTVSLTVAVAIAALGPPLVRGFEDTRDTLLLPFP